MVNTPPQLSQTVKAAAEEADKLTPAENGAIMEEVAEQATDAHVA